MKKKKCGFCGESGDDNEFFNCTKCGTQICLACEDDDFCQNCYVELVKAGELKDECSTKW